MDKYIILHNKHSKISRDFVAANPSYQSIDWYGDQEDPSFQEYNAKEYPSPRAFPSVVDTELKIISDTPATIEEAIQDIAARYDYYRLKKIRFERNDLLKTTKWIQERHKDELELGVATSLTPEKYDEWLQYWKDLRDFPSIVDLDNPVWPIQPE
jgi:hypothetical protein